MGHSGYFHILPILSYDVMNTEAHYLLKLVFSSSDKQPEVGLLDYSSIFSLQKLHTVSIVPALFCIPTNSAQEFHFSISLPTLVISSLSDNSHSKRCEVISHYGFDQHFLD